MPQAQLSDADKDRQQLRTRVHRQSEDIEQLRSQCRAIQNNYDHQVVEHAGAVNKLNAVEVALKAASEKVRQQQDIVTQAQRQKVLFLIATAMFSCSHVHRCAAMQRHWRLLQCNCGTAVMNPSTPIMCIAGGC